MSKDIIEPLGVHITEVTTRKGDQAAEILSVTNSNGFVRSLDAFDKQVFSEDASNYKLVRFDDLAYNPSRINVGSVARCQFKTGGAVSPMYVVVRCKPTLLPQFLLYFLRSDFGKQHIAHRCVGAVRFQLRFSDLAQIQVPIPTPREQERIISILDEASGLGLLREKTGKLTAQLSAAIFNRLIGDPSTNPKKWHQTTFRDILARPLVNGVSPATEGTVPERVLTLGAITGQNFDKSATKEALFAKHPDEQKRVAVKDFLVCRGSGNVELVGSGKFAPESMHGIVFPDTMIRANFNPKLVTTEFIEELWRTAFIRFQCQRSARTTNGAFKINQTALEEIMFPLPPLSLQEELAEDLHQVSEMRTLQGESVSKLNILFQSLVFRAFQGSL